MAAFEVQQRNQEATIYVGDLDEQVDDALLWELFLQVGAVYKVHIPRDKITGKHNGFGFVEFRTPEDADYALHTMNMIKLCGRPLRVNKASATKKALDVGANLFVGGLSDEVDEKLLYDTFSAFGPLISPPKVMRDETGASRGFGFVNFDSFAASDAALHGMNGQFLAGSTINVSYAYKRDGSNERHGSDIERMLAAQNPSRLKPNSRFADSAPTAQAGGAAAAAAAVHPVGAPPPGYAPMMQPPMMPPPMMHPSAPAPGVIAYPPSMPMQPQPGLQGPPGMIPGPPQMPPSLYAYPPPHQHQPVPGSVPVMQPVLQPASSAASAPSLLPVPPPVYPPGAGGGAPQR